MAEELQALIDRIQREAVDTGEQQATKIVAQAREKAAALVKEAEAKASALLEKANRDAEQVAQRGEQALAQSARDLLITVGGGIEKIFNRLVVDAVDQSLSADHLPALLARVVEAYVKEGGKAASLEVLLSEADCKALEGFFRQKFAAALADGLHVTADPRTGKGFKVRRRDQHIEHDFSREAIAEAVANFLRPKLAETVYNVSREV
ncbi:MAG TPA: hypothetical protein PKA51_08300 [Kiritimatiellia bacterium]|nr:hypothetical protein [Kiritimatiellia bacterium]